MASQNIYAQAPLVIERREIRILALAPGTGDDVLCGDLIVESLNYDDLHYTALSYTWSGPVSESAIIIAGVPLNITENLELALLRIRGSTRSKSMWIDAICINQNDDEEKSVQVSLMGDIYASATRAVVWLGEKSADSDVAMDFVHSLRPKDPSQRHHHHDDGGTIGGSDAVVVDDNDANDNPLAVQDLMRREWWTRIWVVQEALMSRRVIVMCGEKTVDMKYFVQLVNENLNQFKRDFDQPFIGILSNWYARKQQAETSGSSLMDLTLSTHSFKASVQKDKVYALLGLATAGARSLIIPDYSNAMSRRLFLIRLTAYFLLFSSKPLLYASHSKATDCPSWVPDWTALDRRIMNLIEGDDVPHSDEPYREPLSTQNDRNPMVFARVEPHIQDLTRYQEPSALLVEGVLIDRVKIAVQIPRVGYNIGNGSEMDAHSVKAKIREWESRIFACLKVCWSEEGKSQSKTRQLLTDELLRDCGRNLKACLIAYLAQRKSTEYTKFDQLAFSKQLRGLNEKYEATELIGRFEAWMQRPSQNACEVCKEILQDNVYSSRCAHCLGDGTLRRSEELGRDIVALNANRTLFLTEHGYHHVECFPVTEDDILCWLPKSSSCFILRRAEEEHWTLVGYLQNMGHPFGGDLLRRNRDKGEYPSIEVFRLK